MKRNTEEDFWNKVDKSGGPDSCWEWVGAIHHSGYGLKQHDGKLWLAHRLAFIFHYKKPPKIICHKCDKKRCCNPSHLYNGTHKSNTRDMLDRGRANPPRGSKVWNSKLNDEKVLSIRKAYAETGKKMHEIATEYGIHPRSLPYIISGRIWSHLPVIKKTLFRKIKGMDLEAMRLIQSEYRGGKTKKYLIDKYKISFKGVNAILKAKL